MNDKRYFKHDSNARGDLKMIVLRKKHGLEGYGVYFCLLEMLCCEQNHELCLDFEALAFDLQVDKKLIEDIVKNFGFFKFKRGKFYSKPFKERMKVLDNIREGWKKGGKKRWEKKDKEDSIYAEFKG